MVETQANSRLRRGLTHLAVFGVVALAYVFGMLEFIECKIVDLRFELLRRDASEDLVLVEIDARSLRSLVGVVTAFTVAHSVTLGLAATEVLEVGRLSGFVEAVIALSIAYVATENVLMPRQDRTRWPEAFVFGLVHGLGFAGFLGEALYGEPRRVVPLLGFNLGVEAGQLLVVLAALGEWSAPEPSTDNSVSRSAIDSGSEFDSRGKWGGYAR